MKINHEQARELARQRGRSLTAVLRDAGVSRTAYYSLVRRPDILPRSVRALAAALEVEPSAFLDEESTLGTRQRRLRRAREICAAHGDADFHNVWHTLILLEQPPIERLNRSLRRARS